MTVQRFYADKFYCLKTEPDPVQYMDNNCGWLNKVGAWWVGKVWKASLTGPGQLSITPLVWGNPGSVYDNGVKVLVPSGAEWQCFSPTWDIHEVPAPGLIPQAPAVLKVGDKVRIRRVDGWMAWLDVMDNSVGHVGTVTEVDNTDNKCARLDIPTAPCRYWFPFQGLDLLTSPTGPPGTCKCPMSTGCRCGAFEAEMKAKGRKYNSTLRVWMQE